MIKLELCLWETLRAIKAVNTWKHKTYNSCNIIYIDLFDVNERNVTNIMRAEKDNWLALPTEIWHTFTMGQSFLVRNKISPAISVNRRCHSHQWLLLLLLRHFSRVRLCATPETAAHQAPCPWDSPGKNTGVGCHFLLQCMKVKSESEVTQSCPTLRDPMDYSLPGSSVHGIFQARVLE